MLSTLADVNLSYALSDAFLARCVGHEALARGFVYATQGAVAGLELDAEDGLLSGLVQGTEAAPYQIRVELAAHGKGLHYGTCSCYVGQNCKHVAAVLVRCRIMLAEALPRPRPAVPTPVRPAWERSLDRLVHTARPVTTGSPVERDRIGLRVEVTGKEPDQPLRLRCRPVRSGRNGNWVQDQMSWSLLEYDWDSRHDPVQRDLLVQLSRIGRAADRYTYYGRGDWVDLSDVTRAVWAVLAELAAAGVALVPGAGRKHAAVEVSEAGASLSLDLSAVTLDGALELSPLVRLGPEAAEARYDRLGFVGHPAHGLVLESADGSLRLAPLEAPLDAAAQEWLEQNGSVRIPGEDRERFLEDFTPRLQQRIVLSSADGSVRLPERPRPELRLEVRHAHAGEVTLSWSVGYRGERSDRAFDPVDRADGDGFRDGLAETELWRGLELNRSWPALVNRRGHPEPRNVSRLNGVVAARFCDEMLPRLTEAGVVVSQVGEERDYRLSSAVPQIEFSTAEIDPDADQDDPRSDWFDLVVDVRIDGELVPFDQLFRALAQEEPYLILETGVYFGLDRPEFAQLLELITEARSLQDRERPGLRINVHQQSLWEELISCGTVAAQAERWSRTIAALAESHQPAEVATPVGLKAELRAYQREGFGWLWRLWSLGLGGILADDMGLGKTVQALALICAAQESEGGGRRPFLVVAPTSVVGNWAAEAARFTPDLRVVALDRSQRKSRTPLAETVAGADLVVTSYTLLRLDAEAYGEQPWAGMLLDEAQFVKNHQAKTYAAIRRMAVPATFAITGTPLENSLMDLWSMLSLTAPGMFPSPGKFTEYYRRPIERGEAPERLERLKQRIAPVMLRRTKALVAAELPAKTEQVIEVELNSRHARIYQTHLQRERQKVLGLIDDLDDNRFTILSSLTLLRQLSLDATLVDDRHDGVPSGKIDLLAELLPELVAEGHRALVFSQFTGFLRRIGDRLREEGVDYVYLDGRTKDRAATIEQFRTGDAGVFLISLKAGGFGLNLTEADYCFVCDPWWNPAAETQAVDRAHRIGQTRPVMVYRLVSKDTIEHKVMDLKARKEKLFSAVMDADGLPPSALTADDIRSLLAG